MEAIHAAIRAARTVIVQFNRAMPRTLGESFIHVDEIDFAVEVDVPPYEHPVGEIGDVERRIGAYVADLIPDRATLQLGIGAIPAATALFLRDKRDLGIHTEMFTDSVVDLVEAGAVTGNAKERNRGKIVTAFVLGTERLYDFVHDNPMVEMRSGRLHQRLGGHPQLPPDGRDQLGDRGRPHRPGRRRLDRSRGCTPGSVGRWTSSGGGPGAGGRAIIALPSTAAGGTVSRIAATLQPGAGVVTTRAHVRTVVTEYGVADLFGKSVASGPGPLRAPGLPRPPPIAICVAPDGRADRRSGTSPCGPSALPAVMSLHDAQSMDTA